MESLGVLIATKRDHVLERDVQLIQYSLYFSNESSEEIIYNTNFVENLTSLLQVVVQTGFTTFQEILENNKKQQTYKYEDIINKIGKSCKKIKNECQCTICHEDLKQNQLYRPLPCNHIFHKKCIDQWFKNNNPTCPLCRVDFMKEN